MSDTLKVLGQSAPMATTLTDLYVVPAFTNVTVSSLTVCNRGAVVDAFRISVAVAGAGDAPEQYLYYDMLIGASDTFVATIGITLNTTDVLRVYAGTADLSFQAFGVEVT